MATFEIQQGQFQRWVKITIDNDAVRAEAGALSYMRGHVEVDTPLPSLGDTIKCSISGEPLIRPRYKGRGEIYLTSTFGGYHAFTISDTPWILEDGAYWASDDSVQLGLHRERMVTSFWAGEGFIDYQTKVSGRGRVVLNADGPVEEIELGDETISVEGKLVRLNWRISNGETFRGTGYLKGNTLTIDWGQTYPVIYKVGDDGVLRGTWSRGRGKENLIPKG